MPGNPFKDDPAFLACITSMEEAVEHVSTVTNIDPDAVAAEFCTDGFAFIVNGIRYMRVHGVGVMVERVGY